MFDQFVGVFENAAPEEFCDEMIARHKIIEETASLHKGSEDNGGTRIRKDFSTFFDRDAVDLAAKTNVILDECLAKYTDEYPFFADVPVYSVAVKVQRTPPKGGFHMWHCERTHNVSSRTRELVWMIYLNDTPEGEGTTEFLELGIKLQPKKGTVVMFPANWTHAHRGNPVYTQDKYIATGWYYLQD